MGNTLRALQEVERTLHEEGIDTTLISIGCRPQPDCIACDACGGTQECAIGGETYQLVREALEQSDGLIVGSPIYFAGPTGAICSLLDRVFRSCKPLLMYKPAAAVAVCRRGGASAGLDRLNKYFQLYNMPQVTSSYWNMVHGAAPGEVEQDAEGMQTMRTLAHNMAWMLRHLSSADRPKAEAKIKTNFIR